MRHACLVCSFATALFNKTEHFAADKLARKKLKSNPRHTALLMEAAQIQRDIIREARKEVSAKHQTRASNPVQLTLSKK